MITLDLTKNECDCLLEAICTAVEKESAVVERLVREKVYRGREDRSLEERERHLALLRKLQKRIRP